jgi:hypothetical protein
MILYASGRPFSEDYSAEGSSDVNDQKVWSSALVRTRFCFIFSVMYLKHFKQCSVLHNCTEPFCITQVSKTPRKRTADDGSGISLL